MKKALCSATEADSEALVEQIEALRKEKAEAQLVPQTTICKRRLVFGLAHQVAAPLPKYLCLCIDKKHMC